MFFFSHGWTQSWAANFVKPGLRTWRSLRAYFLAKIRLIDVDFEHG